jgi:hypothetical protein
VGKHEGKKGDYGETHIERPERLRQLQENGYQNARDLVQDATNSFDTIFKGDRVRLILSKRGGVTDTTLFVELTPADDGDFYDVKTGLIAQKTTSKRKRRSGHEPETAYKIGSVTAHYLLRENPPPQALSWGNPTILNIWTIKRKSQVLFSIPVDEIVSRCVI